MAQLTDVKKRFDESILVVDGNEKGNLATSPAGNLVLLPRGSVSVENPAPGCAYVSGLKEGFELATMRDWERLAQNATKAESAPSKAKPRKTVKAPKGELAE